MSAGGFKREVYLGHDVITVLTPHYQLKVRVRGRRAKIIAFECGDQLPKRSMDLTAGETDNTARGGWLWRLFAPRLIQLCPTCGGGKTKHEIRVTLPQMVAHRAAACNACPTRRRWIINFCGRPGIPQWRWLRWIHAVIGKRKAPGCGCILWIKHHIAAADCGDGKWIARNA